MRQFFDGIDAMPEPLWLLFVALLFVAAGTIGE
jgi:hypothetical protein